MKKLNYFVSLFCVCSAISLAAMKPAPGSNGTQGLGQSSEDGSVVITITTPEGTVRQETEEGLRQSPPQLLHRSGQESTELAPAAAAGAVELAPSAPSYGDAYLFLNRQLVAAQQPRSGSPALVAPAVQLPAAPSAQSYGDVWLYFNRIAQQQSQTSSAAVSSGAASSMSVPAQGEGVQGAHQIQQLIGVTAALIVASQTASAASGACSASHGLFGSGK